MLVKKIYRFHYNISLFLVRNKYMFFSVLVFYGEDPTHYKYLYIIYHIFFHPAKFQIVGVIISLDNYTSWKVCKMSSWLN